MAKFTRVEQLDKFRKFLDQFNIIDDEDFEAAVPYFRYREYKRNEFLHKGGNTCKEIAFILDGAVRSFYNINGNDITRFVLLKDAFVTALSSFIMQESSLENIQAITHVQALVVTKEDIEALYRKYHHWETIGRMAIERSHLLLEKRILALISLTAEERYKALSIEQPELLRYIPLQYIASILGVKPETLSRIRKKMSM